MDAVEMKSFKTDEERNAYEAMKAHELSVSGKAEDECLGRFLKACGPGIEAFMNGERDRGSDTTDVALGAAKGFVALFHKLLDRLPYEPGHDFEVRDGMWEHIHEIGHDVNSFLPGGPNYGKDPRKATGLNYEFRPE